MDLPIEPITYERNVARERGLENLSKLADVVERAEDGKEFNYAYWVGEDWNGAKTALECGTTACAFGLATNIPEFGIAFKPIGTRGNHAEIIAVDDPSLIFEAIAESVFAVTYAEFAFLFLPKSAPYDIETLRYTEAEHNEYGELTRYAKAKTVAKHIRRFVAEGGVYEQGVQS